MYYIYQYYTIKSMDFISVEEITNPSGTTFLVVQTQKITLSKLKGKIYEEKYEVVTKRRRSTFHFSFFKKNPASRLAPWSTQPN